jgi:DNA-binding NarL/FixJ family response regulator
MTSVAESAGVDVYERVRVLSPRELEVLGLISHGLTNGEVAERLHVSVHAVKFHLAAIYRRLGVSNRTEAAVAYLRAQSEPAAPRRAAAGSID